MTGVQTCALPICFPVTIPDITTLGKKISTVPPKIVFTDDYEDEPDNDDEEKLLN